MKFAKTHKRSLLLVLFAVALLLIAAVPAWGAANSVSISSPTQSSPAYSPPGGDVLVQYSLAASAPDDVEVRITVSSEISGIIGDTGWYLVRPTVAGEVYSYSGSRMVSLAASAADGKYAVIVKARQGSQTEPVTQSESDSVVVDTVKPAVTISNIPEYANLTEITGTASDATARVNRVEIQIKRNSDNKYWNGSDNWITNEAWLDATGTASWSYSITDGPFESGKSYTVKARAVDNAGNVTEEAAQPTATFTFDNAPPTVSIGAGLPTGDTNSVPSVVDGSAADQHSGVQQVEVQLKFTNSSTDYYWNGSVWQIGEIWLTASGTASWTFSMPVLTSGREYTFTARATDRAGNQAVVSRTFRYLTAAPGVAITAPEDGSFQNADFDQVVGTADPGAVVKVQLRRNADGAYWTGSTWSAAETWLDVTNNDYWAYNVSSLTDGNTANGEFTDGAAYTVKAKATDGAGNVATAQAVFTCDITPPLAAISDIPPAVGSLTQIIGTASDATAGVAKVEVQIKRNSDNNYNYWNGSGWITNETWLDATGTTSWSYSITGSPFESGKSYTVKARAVDNAGNVTEAAAQPTDTFTFEAVPSIAINTITDYVNTPPSIGGTANDQAPGAVVRVEVQLHNQTDGTYWNGSAWAGSETWLTATGTASWSYSTPAGTFADGKTYVVRARALDNVGQLSEVASATFTFDTTAPTVTLAGIPDRCSLTQITGTASDATAGVNKVEIQIKRNSDNKYWNGSDNWITNEAWLDATGTASWSYSITDGPFESGKSYTVKARAVDNAGNVTADTTQPSATFTFDPGAQTVTLKAGWNLVSLPLIPNDPAIENVLAEVGNRIEVVWAYDAATGNWSSYAPGAPSDLAEMRDGRGYWVKVTPGADCSFTVDGVELPLPPQLPPSYELVPGWNLIGFKSTEPTNASTYMEAMAGKYTVIYGFDAATQRYYQVTGNLQPGQGYWIAVTAPGRIYP